MSLPELDNWSLPDLDDYLTETIFSPRDEEEQPDEEES